MFRSLSSYCTMLGFGLIFLGRSRNNPWYLFFFFIIKNHQDGGGLGQTPTCKINQPMNEHKEGDINQNLPREANVLAINIQTVQVKMINVEYMESQGCPNEECQISQLEVPQD